MEVLIKNVKIIDFAHSFYGDIYIYAGKVFEIGKIYLKIVK
jgi:urease alpha subunit